jgi:hypothetical protein
MKFLQVAGIVTKLHYYFTSPKEPNDGMVNTVLLKALEPLAASLFLNFSINSFDYI